MKKYKYYITLPFNNEVNYSASFYGIESVPLGITSDKPCMVLMFNKLNEQQANFLLYNLYW